MKDTTLTKIELKMLIDQLTAERDALKQENERYRKEIDKITNGIPSEWAYAILKKERDRLREALEFYADMNNYDLSTCKVSEDVCLSGSFVVMKDEGKRARQALTAIEGGGE